MESICVAVLARRFARRGAKVGAGTSDERRNDTGACENATRMGRHRGRIPTRPSGGMRGQR